MATILTRTRYTVTFYVYFLSCFCIWNGRSWIYFKV